MERDYKQLSQAAFDRQAAGYDVGVQGRRRSSAAHWTGRRARSRDQADRRALGLRARRMARMYITGPIPRAGRNQRRRPRPRPAA